MSKPSARQQLTDRIACMRRQGLTWRAIGPALGVPAGTACRLQKQPDYEPRNSDVRRQLGLPVLGLAPVCACGQVHVGRHPRRQPTYDERCAAWDKWQAEHALEVAAIVAALK